MSRPPSGSPGDPEFDCAVVGAGPAGAVLGLLLARAGLRILLLEAAADFDREFRGDTLNPSSMEIMDEMGLAEGLLALPHSKIHKGVGESPDGKIQFYDFARLHTRFPYVTMMPQARFLEFVTGEALLSSGFELRMESRVHELLVDGQGRVGGVRFHDGERLREARATLTIGCDGRGSAIRRLAGLEGVRTSPPMDVLWFRLPHDGTRSRAGFRSLIGPGLLLVLVDRGDHWQAGCVIRKGSLGDLRRKGVDAFRESLAGMASELAGPLEALDDWGRISVLSVQSMRLPLWWRPGLLLIGDAAHVMSPVGGAGIGLAIQDAVVAANVVAQPLRKGVLEDAHLRRVQQSRAPAAYIVQRFQALVERFLVSAAIEERGSMRWAGLLRLPLVGALPSRLVGLGPWRVHVKSRTVSRTGAPRTTASTLPPDRADPPVLRADGLSC